MRMQAEVKARVEKISQAPGRHASVKRRSRTHLGGRIQDSVALFWKTGAKDCSTHDPLTVDC